MITEWCVGRVRDYRVRRVGVWGGYVITEWRVGDYRVVCGEGVRLEWCVGRVGDYRVLCGRLQSVVWGGWVITEWCDKFTGIHTQE